MAFHCAEAISFGAFHALGYEGYNISFGLQLSCYYLYLKATGNLEMKKIESNSSNLYLNIAILQNAYQIFRCSHTYYHRNCINKFKNVKEILFTNLLYTVHVFWFRPLKRCIRIHYKSASIRKSQENSE